MGQERAERTRQRNERRRGRESRWTAARALNDAIGGLVQQLDAGVIDEARYQTSLAALVAAAPEGVQRTARRINKAAREALRSDTEDAEGGTAVDETEGAGEPAAKQA